jgi:protease I
MRLITTLLAALILLSLGAVPSLAQYYGGYDDGYYDGYEEGHTCWMCPNCGLVVQLDVQVDESATEYQTTLGEVMYLNPYDTEDYCPYCGTYGAYFVLVPCSGDYEDEEEYGDYEEYEDGEYYEDYEGGEEYSEIQEEYEETEYVETGEECADGDEIDVNDTEEITAVASTETPAEEAGKILIVIPSKDFNDDEFSASETLFLDEGFEVVVASKGTEEALGMDGTAVAVDLAVADAYISDYEAVVFIGGPGVDDLELYEDPDYVNLASSTRDQDVIVGAICVAPKILANAWLLGGRKATVSPDSESIAYIEAKGATYSDEQVVRDGKIITGSGPEASEEFAEALVTALKEGQA